MAIVHFAIKPRTVSGPQAASRAVAYLKREREYAPRQEVGYLRRERVDVQDRQDLVWERTQNLPAWAAGDPYRFFEAAATYERVNGRWAVALEMALPRELSRDGQAALVDDFLLAQLPDKPALVVMHEPRDRVTGDPQPHIHVLMSTRGVDGFERGPAQYFRRANPDDPVHGGAPKDPFWGQRQCPGRVRVAYTDLANLALEREGHSARLDPRTLEARGIAREPEARGAWASGSQSLREMARVSRGQTLREEYVRAQDYWEQRKRVLGIERASELSRREAVDRVARWTRDFRPGSQLPPRDLRAAVASLRQEQVEVGQASARLSIQLAAAARDERQGVSQSWESARRAERTMQEAERLIPQAPPLHLSLLLPGEERAQGRLKVRLRDVDRGDERSPR